MTLGRKTGGRDFKEGNPGGPGRPKTDKALRDAKKISALLVEQSIQFLGQMNYTQLAAFLGNPAQKKLPHATATALDLMIGGQMLAAMKGRTTPFRELIDRTAGPVTRKIKIEGNPFDELANLTPEEQEALRAKIRKRRG